MFPRENITRQLFHVASLLLKSWIWGKNWIYLCSVSNEYWYRKLHHNRLNDSIFFLLNLDGRLQNFEGRKHSLQKGIGNHQDVSMVYIGVHWNGSLND